MKISLARQRVSPDLAWCRFERGSVTFAVVSPIFMIGGRCRGHWTDAVFASFGFFSVDELLADCLALWGRWLRSQSPVQRKGLGGGICADGLSGEVAGV